MARTGIFLAWVHVCLRLESFGMKDFITPTERIGDEVLADGAYLRMQRARALGYLGNKWRGDPACTHRYTDSSGRTIELIYPRRTR